MAHRPNFPLPEAQIVTLFLLSVTYGIYLVSAGLCARVLFTSDSGKKLKYWLLAVAVTMFVLTTTDVALALVDILRVFVFYKGPKTAEEQFENLSDWVNVMSTADIQLMSLIGDGMLVYRCYIVYSRRWTVVILPAVLWVAGGGCGVAIVSLTATIHTGDIVTSLQLAHIIISFLVVTLVTNILTTGLIVWRIRQVDNETSSAIPLSKGKRSRLANAMRVIIESGLLYTVFVLLSLITEVSGSNAAYVVAQMMLVVIGISFNLIIIRVGQGTAVGGTYNAPTIGGTVSTVIRFTEPLNEARGVRESKAQSPALFGSQTSSSASHGIASGA